MSASNSPISWHIVKALHSTAGSNRKYILISKCLDQWENMDQNCLCLELKLGLQNQPRLQWASGLTGVHPVCSTPTICIRNVSCQFPNFRIYWKITFIESPFQTHSAIGSNSEFHIWLWRNTSCPISVLIAIIVPVIITLVRALPPQGHMPYYC